MKFYINSFYDRKVRDTEYGQDAIGLFGKHKFEGRGNCCGWYGTEYYLNTELYAHYTADGSGLYSPKKRLTDVVVCDPPIKYDEIMIGSCYWELVIEAGSVEEAVKKFKNGDWARS